MSRAQISWMIACLPRFSRAWLAPTTNALLSVVRAGRAEVGMVGVGEGKASDGSRHLIAVVDRPDPRPIWVTVWRGANTLAQTLCDVRATRSFDEVERFVSKLRVYTISDQEDAGAWLRREFPSLSYIVSPSTVDVHEYYRATWSGSAATVSTATGRWRTSTSSTTRG